MTIFAAKRIYEEIDESDGYRVLVDRLWPRGVSKERAALDEWAKNLAPSNDLRQWFGHIPDRYEEFAKKYLEEIEQNPESRATIKAWYNHDKVTLLYAARDKQHNEARVLLGMLRQQTK